MIKRNSKLLLAAFCCVTALKIYAQLPGYTAVLDSVKTPGFYQLHITPELSACLKTDLADLRIKDDRGNEVPYITRSLLPLFNQTVFNEFKILSNERNDSGNSVLVIENGGLPLKIGNHPANTINEIVLFIKNTSASRYASLSGSNNSKEWYSINDRFLLSRTYQGSRDYFVSEIQFEAADYKYFKLVIDNENSDPLNIIKAGSYADIALQRLPSFLINPAAKISQKDSTDKFSYITVEQPLPFQTDKIAIAAGGTRFFKRNVLLYLPENDSSQKPMSPAAASFTISSAGLNEFAVKKFRSKFFYLVIENADNPPLQISAVTCMQEPFCAVAYFENNRAYHIEMGNDTAIAPVYDLASFKDSIAAAVPLIKAGPVQKTTGAAATVRNNTGNNRWLWPSIAVALLVLALLTFKLLAEMKKKNL